MLKILIKIHQKVKHREDELLLNLKKNDSNRSDLKLTDVR